MAKKARAKTPSQSRTVAAKRVTPKETVVATTEGGFFQDLRKRWVSNATLAKVADYRASKRVYLVILLLGLLLLAYYKKDWFVAAMVNGQPISNLELQQRLNQQYRQQVLNQMVNEKVVTDAAAQKNITVSQSEVNQKISDYEKSVGGPDVLNSLLSQQGQTREGFERQVRLQLLVEKLYGSEATVSAQEVNDFINQNKAQLQASDEAGQTKEATDAIKQQKLSQVFQQKFQALRQAAKIQIF